MSKKALCLSMFQKLSAFVSSLAFSFELAFCDQSSHLLVAVAQVRHQHCAGLSAHYALWMGNCCSGDWVHDSLENMSRTHSLMEEVWAPFVSCISGRGHHGRLPCGVKSHGRLCEGLWAIWRLPFHLL